VGQSLPNWGPVSEKGGRTVAMTNLYTDLDSRESLKNQMSALYCKATMDQVSTDPKPQVMSTVLHEAAHNLGPAHDYAVKGKKDDAVFGGPLAATMEELKAQTSALFFAGWLADKGIITRDDATDAALRDIAWAFGHISRGMYDAEGHARNYSQLASARRSRTVRSRGSLPRPRRTGPTRAASKSTSASGRPRSMRWRSACFRRRAAATRRTRRR
jgi:hypothetical protein